MSLSRLSTVAVQRDSGPPRRAKRKPTTAKEAQETEQQNYFNLLVSAIPTEPLGLYTFVIGIIVATIDTGEDQRLGIRWAIYAAMIGFIVLWLGTSYMNRPKRDKKRHVPLVETLSAVIAFATWGLVMPESPLSAELSGDTRTIWTVIITAIGVAALSLLTNSMKKPAKKTN
jgi:hypothetical protein